MQYARRVMGYNFTYKYLYITHTLSPYPLRGTLISAISNAPLLEAVGLTQGNWDLSTWDMIISCSSLKKHILIM